MCQREGAHPGRPFPLLSPEENLSDCQAAFRPQGRAGLVGLSLSLMPPCAATVPQPCSLSVLWNGSGEGVSTSSCLSPHLQCTCEAGEHFVNVPSATSLQL